jgi:hypothetical protein
MDPVGSKPFDKTGENTSDAPENIFRCSQKGNLFIAIKKGTGSICMSSQ